MEVKSNIKDTSDVKMSSKGGFKAVCKQVIVFPFVLLIKIYQVCISPFTPSSCRFTPTCSSYSLQAFKKYGPLKGFWLSFKRIIRCHPWGGSGYDPIP